MKPLPFVLLALAALGPAALPQDAERVSAFGVYRGYGAPRFDGFERESFYVAMRDGTELACDLYRPSKGGEVTEEPLPLVWTHDRYHRAASSGDGAVPTKLFVYDWLRALLNHGYLVAAVDVRGAGASFGTWQGIFNEEETRDAYDIVEWFAAQDWCDGRIGMYGGSYLGGTQLMAASRKPPHLEALFPWVAPADLYAITWSGGIFRDDLCRIWGDLTHELDRSTAVATIQGDEGGELRAEAQKEHEGNRAFADIAARLPFRDSGAGGKAPWIAQSPISHLAEIEGSGVAIYHQGGWFDPFSRDAFVLFANLANPQKLVMGPWFHTEASGVDWSAEALRWFDYWLKGIENGVMDEAPIHYFTMGAPAGDGWRATDTWPLPQETRVAYHFHGGPSGSIESVNDGLLATRAPDAAGGDDYTVDYATSSGPITRWSVAVGRGGSNPRYMDLRENDARSLTYTTSALAADLEVTGHPVVYLWVASEAPDGDFFVFLEEVLPDGTSEYVTEGCLRASHRRLADPPHDVLGLPYHSGLRADAAPESAAPVELAFDLFPVSNVFDAGHRMRVSIAGADDENALTPPIPPAPTFTLLRGGRTPSRIDLPVIPP